MVRKKSVDVGAGSSIVIPFLKGAKSIEDKVAFLKSVQRNSSLNDYDRNLVGRVLERYSANKVNGNNNVQYHGSRRLSDEDYKVDTPLFCGDAFDGPRLSPVPSKVMGVVREFFRMGREEYGAGNLSRAKELYGKGIRVILEASDRNGRPLSTYPLEGVYRSSRSDTGWGSRSLGGEGPKLGEDYNILTKKFGLNPDDCTDCMGVTYNKLLIPPYDLKAHKEVATRRTKHHSGLNYSDSESRETQRGTTQEMRAFEQGRKYQIMGRYISKSSIPNQGLQNYLGQDKQIQNGTYQSSQTKFQPHNSFDNIKSPRSKTAEKVGVTMAVAGFGASIFFIGSNFTGNVIGSLSVDTTNLIGVGAFLVGIVGAMLCFKRKK